MPSVKDIRTTIISKLEDTMTEFMWVTGEPLVDIIDSIAEFHFKRETIVNLTQSLSKISGFARLLYDASYRSIVASALELSTTTRTKVYRGVPNTVDNDLDAFIWYYLDRLGERLGYKRGSGSSASATCNITFPASLTTGTMDLILKSGDRVYKIEADISTWTAVTSTTSSVEAKIISFGYGARYNALPNTVSEIISLTYTAGVVTIDQLAVTHEEIKHGTDYQSNNAFYQLMEDNSSAAPGLGTRNNIATIISSDETVDKFLIQGTDANRRFMGSMDIYLKTSVREVRTEQMITGSDQQVVVPYQPSEVLGVTTTAGIAIAYTTSPTAVDFENTVKQNTYVDLSAVVAGTTVLLTFSLDTTCQNVNTAINDYYSSRYEYARDYLIHQAQPCPIDITMQVKLKTATKRDVAESLINDQLESDIDDLSIYDGVSAGKIDGSDFIASAYNIYYNGDQLIDSFVSLTITKVTPPTPDDAIGATGTIYPDEIGEYFEIRTLTIAVI